MRLPLDSKIEAEWVTVPAGSLDAKYVAPVFGEHEASVVVGS
jgi:hypothetical protein